MQSSAKRSKKDPSEELQIPPSSVHNQQKLITPSPLEDAVGLPQALNRMLPPKDPNLVARPPTGMKPSAAQQLKSMAGSQKAGSARNSAKTGSGRRSGSGRGPGDRRAKKSDSINDR